VPQGRSWHDSGMPAVLDDVLVCPDSRSSTRKCGCGNHFPFIDGVRVMLPKERSALAETFYELRCDERHGRAAMPDYIGTPVGRFLDSLEPDALVIEIGTGRCAFHGWHPRLVFTDYSLLALQRFSSGDRAQLDAERLPFRDASVDAFLTIATFEHLPHPERALAEIDRCLRPTGRAFIYPAWLVYPWASKNLAGRKYGDLSWLDKARKSTIALRKRRAYRFAAILPGRLLRECLLLRSRPIPFSYTRLNPCFDRYLTSDSDAFVSMDPHSCAAYFRSRRVSGGRG
jgi:SAM-dependent methyltransferase